MLGMIDIITHTCIPPSSSPKLNEEGRDMVTTGIQHENEFMNMVSFFLSQYLPRL